MSKNKLLNIRYDIFEIWCKPFLSSEIDRLSIYPRVISQIKTVTRELFYCTRNAIGALRFTYKGTTFKQSVFLIHVPITVETKIYVSQSKLWRRYSPQWLFTAETERLQHWSCFFLYIYIYTADDYPMQKKTAPVLCVVWVMLPFPNWVRPNVYSRGEVF